jgi:putative transposase
VPDTVSTEPPADFILRRIEALVLEFPGYGYRRVTRQLQREGCCINHKRVLALMRNHGLLCRSRRRWVATTDSKHGLRVYPNLVPGLRVETLNQLWVSDLTYIRLPQRFCYLAVVLDAYSRKVIGWSLSRWLAATVAVEALEQALRERQPSAGLVHHSDQGVQYACRAYVERLLSMGAAISMSRRGRPRDNAQAESFFRTLKMEEVYLQEYQDYDEALACIEHFITAVYNRKRLHSSLAYVPPEEFETLLMAAKAK